MGVVIHPVFMLYAINAYLHLMKTYSNMLNLNSLLTGMHFLYYFYK